MLDQLLAQEDNVEDMRQVFLEADVDYSGYLSVSELWAALKKKGADVTLNDVIELMAEIDVDRDG
jgi:Ca2+-binding EF-hand superfamily protein